MTNSHALASAFPKTRTPLRYLVSCLDGKRVPLNAEERSKIPGNIPYWGANGVVDFINDWLFDEELVLLGEDGAPFCEMGKDVAFVVQGKVWVNNHIHVLRANSGVSARFLTYALNSVDYSQYINGSTRDKLTQDSMRSISLLVPDLKTQITIADVLDRETADADALVAKYERLIELLEEKRVALITQAVTKGLDPSVPMKESGVEWIGKIPAGWTLKPLKRIAKRLSVGIVIEPSKYFSSDGRPYIHGNNIGDGSLLLDDVKRISEFDSNSNKKSRLACGDLVTMRVGEPGRTAVVTEDCEGGNCASVILIKGNASFNSDWLRFVMNSKAVRTQIEMDQNGSAQQVLNVGDAMNIAIPTPTLAEQKQIAEALRHFEDDSLESMSQVRRAIGLVQERRSALVTAAVTGQIKVNTYHSKS